MKRIVYIAASDSFEAFHRFRAGLYSDVQEEARETSEILHLKDRCEPKCRYDIYQATIEIENVEDGYGL